MDFLLFSPRYSYIGEGFVGLCVVWNLNGNNCDLINIYSSCSLNELEKKIVGRFGDLKMRIWRRLEKICLRRS